MHSHSMIATTIATFKHKEYKIEQVISEAAWKKNRTHTHTWAFILWKKCNIKYWKISTKLRKMMWALAFFERIKRKMEMGNENEKVNLFVQVFIGFAHHKYITNNSWNDYAVFFAIYYHALDLSTAKSILEHTCKVDDFFFSLFHVLCKHRNTI